MSVMITGGAGFIGLNVTEQLLRAGRRVVCFGLDAPAPAFVGSLGAAAENLIVERGDVRDRARARTVMKRHKVSAFVHGAAVTAGPARELREPDVVASVNLGGTIEMLEAAVQHGVRRFVQLSSGSVFGAGVKTEGFLHEEADRPVPDSLYGITKYAAERVAIRYRSRGRLDAAVVRLGTCFGRWEHDTGQRDTLSIPFRIMQLAQQGERAVYGAQYPDDWVYASDVARGILMLLDAPSLPRALYQLSAGKRWSLPTWCERVRSAYPAFSHELTDDPVRANVGTSAPSPRPPFAIGRISADVGYRPQYLDECAFEDYLKWWRAWGREMDERA